MSLFLPVGTRFEICKIEAALEKSSALVRILELQVLIVIPYSREF
jgi:hypothetical protein